MADREDAVIYVAAVLSAPLATAGFPRRNPDDTFVPLDTSGSLKEPLDAAEAAMELVTIPETDAAGIEAAYMALVRYHVLLRIRDEIALRFDVGIAGDSYRLSQSQAQIEKLLTDAREAAIFLAGSAAVAGGTGADAITSGPGIGAIELDWSGGDSVTDEYTGWSDRW